MYKFAMMFQTVFILFIAFTFSADARDIMKPATVGGMRIELHILPAEPFFTADEVTVKKVKAGMLIMGGAEPLALNANAHPNHHLVVHIFDTNTGKAITTAQVSINFQQLNTKKKPIGDPINVPIVIMQAIGKGVESTHYGNNVVMSTGYYSITVVANGKKVDFQMRLPKNAIKPSDKMDMH